MSKTRYRHIKSGKSNDVWVMHFVAHGGGGRKRIILLFSSDLVLPFSRSDGTARINARCAMHHFVKTVIMKPQRGRGRGMFVWIFFFFFFFLGG